jgi:8-oxo-dGTP pyrophosphatase MutT (NUDIX family)
VPRPQLHATASIAEPQIEFADQYGALPWRKRKDGSVEVMLVTSRISRHWLIPKGWRIEGKDECRSALQEAFEEAGVRGECTGRTLGRYNYIKLLKDGTSVPCVVTVFGLRVRKTLDKWPEAQQRTRGWYALPQAAQLVNEPGLAAFLATLTPASFQD